MKVSAETVRENDLEQQILNDTMELQDAADCKEPGASEIQEWALALESDLDQGWASLPIPSPRTPSPGAARTPIHSPRTPSPGAAMTPTPDA